jgi:hypothetical protein
MGWATSLPAGVVFAGSLVVTGVVATLVHLSLHRLVRPGHRESIGVTAAAYMTAVGSLFAILTGFLINAEYGNLRHTQDLIADEASGATRLAWATQGLTAVDASLVQDALATYLDDLKTDEWAALADGKPEQSRAAHSLSQLQGKVFNIASRSYVPTASADAMTGAVGDLTSARRQRIASSSDDLPTPLFVLSAVAGFALIVNAVGVTLRSGPWSTVVAIGIVVVVALDLALIVAIAAPFQGGFVASPAPIAKLYAEMRNGVYLPWTGY